MQEKKGRNPRWKCVETQDGTEVCKTCNGGLQRRNNPDPMKHKTRHRPRRIKATNPKETHTTQRRRNDDHQFGGNQEHYSETTIMERPNSMAPHRSGRVLDINKSG
jgi:hypothetical protein